MKSSEEYLNSIYEKQEVCKLKLKQKKSRRRIMVASVAGIMCLVLAFVFVVEPMLSGKDKYVLHAADLMEDYNSNKSVKNDGKEADETFVKAYTDFALELFSKTADTSENVLISPLSIYFALAMTANGADGETLSQMEEVLGLDMESLNAYMLAYANSLSSTDTGKFNIANSIWFRNDGSLKVNDEFLQTNADYYSADAFAAEFDEKTVADINSWVKAKTDGMIESIIDSLSPDDMMCLINTVLFDAEWEHQYDYRAVRKNTFVNVNGDSYDVDFLGSTESICLVNEDAVGIIKSYKNKQYSFVALLPDEDISIYEFVRTLTGDKWLELIENKRYEGVVTKIPKFEYDYMIELNDILIKMGIQDAFDESKADFSKTGSLVDGSICISDIFHKSRISVAELGTKAGAATVVIESATGAIPQSLTFDRPFVYAIMDNNTNLPIFIGTVMDVGNGDNKAIVSGAGDVKEIEDEIEEEPVEYCEGILKYTVDENGEAKITGVTDKAIEKVVVPERIGITEDFEGYVVTCIGDSSFRYCYELAEVILPDTLTSIEDLAFWCCLNLEKIEIPAGVRYVGAFSLANCDKLTEIILPDGLTTVEYKTFFDSNNIEKVVIPDSVTVIEEGAFERCYKLTEVNIPKNLTYIGWAAFEECDGITKLEMPKTVVKIEPDAFKYCTNLEEVLLPETVEYIGPTAFWEDTKLTIITPAGSYAESYANKKSINVRIQ